MSHKPLPWQSAPKQNRIDECDGTNKKTRKGHLPVERTVEIKETISYRDEILRKYDNNYDEFYREKDSKTGGYIQQIALKILLAKENLDENQARGLEELEIHNYCLFIQCKLCGNKYCTQKRLEKHLKLHCKEKQC